MAQPPCFYGGSTRRRRAGSVSKSVEMPCTSNQSITRKPARMPPRRLHPAPVGRRSIRAPDVAQSPAPAELPEGLPNRLTVFGRQLAEALAGFAGNTMVRNVTKRAFCAPVRITVVEAGPVIPVTGCAPRSKRTRVKCPRMYRS